MSSSHEIEMAVRRVGDAISNLGDASSAPSLEVIKSREKQMGICVPIDYLEFLNRYGSGDIFGNELFSFYATSSDVPSGDLLFKFNSYLKRGRIIDCQLPFLSTDFGELFVFDRLPKYPTRLSNANVVIIRRETSEIYSDSFIRFLYKYSESNRG